MKLVVVESPAKAKTINKYLGEDYRVLASVGHIRDLPVKDGSVNPEDGFAMKWELSARSTKPIADIRGALADASKLILATDPDREGEAISWHVLEVMNQKKALGATPVERVVFNEVTKTAILDAMARPRPINTALVEAYLARRALDYLVGFGISPVLWRKLPGAKSAGRVQSVALKLICERESEIEAFKATEYWSVHATLSKKDDSWLTARLTHIDGKKLAKYALGDEAAALAAVAKVDASTLIVEEVETKRIKRNPAPPFTTSTLQQEASRKLGFSAKRTMQIAQKLYEGVNIGTEVTGLITYMRTDGVQLSTEAVIDIRKAITALKGNRYLPTTPRAYKSRAANAQEAHEAIRPTSIARKPDDIAKTLDTDQAKLYDLIWRRTMASQMQSAEIDQTRADIIDRGGKVTLRANGSVIIFDGFLTLYRESIDDSGKKTASGSASANGSASGTAAQHPNANNGDSLDDGGDDDSGDNDRKFLPPLAAGEPLSLIKTKPEQHFTQPPPRYTDASLVKKMEELGIGRPSTYASIISVLQDRGYVSKDKNRFIPAETGRITAAFLESFFTRYVEYGFTARLEEDLDRVSDGKLEWKELLASFWVDFKAQIDGMADLTRAEVLEKIDTLLEGHFFANDDNDKNIRQCTHCADGVLGLKLGRYGAFIGCSRYPECRYTRQLDGDGGEESHDAFAEGEKLLGADPETATEVWLKKGPYGLYVQYGVGKKPRRSSLPKEMAAASLTLTTALALLNLPRDIGAHPTTGEAITAGIGRYGAYLKYGGNYISLPNDDTVITIGINHAVEIIDKSGKTPARSLGTPSEGGEIRVKSGRYGVYVEQDGIRATIPKKLDSDALTLDDALALIADKKAKGGNPWRTNHRSRKQKK